MRRHLAYARYVMRHKWFVFVACIKLGVPLWIAVFHDWDKFLPDEWFPYARAFYKPDGTSQYAPDETFTTAWNAHQKRNKHHWQYWMITWDRGETECLMMPEVYSLEMLADWIGAGRALGKPDTKAWYIDNKDKIRLHPMTRAFIEMHLKVSPPTNADAMFEILRRKIVNRG